MNGALLLAASIAVFVLAYFVYGGLLSRLLGIDGSKATPAKTMGDGVDYVPAHPAVLFGHHFASIAGAGPIVGPIAAAYFGWGAVVAWVLLGCVFIGAVHDMVSLFLSVRHEGKSIASVIETVLGRPGKILFLLFCWSTLILVCAEFTRQVAVTFVHSPEVATASLLFIALAVVFGVAINRMRVPLLPATIVAVPVMFGCIWAGTKAPIDFAKIFGMSPGGAQTVWTMILLAYCFLASTLPVWLLLQPRDYLNSYLLYAMMALGFAGVFTACPEIQLDAFAGWHAANAKGIPQPLFPILFITIACGACSGFHALVASGTTAKQIADERHIRPVAYGGMLLEGVLAMLALIAVGTFAQADLAPKLAAPGPVSLFASGLAGFCTKLGIPQQAGYTFMCLAVSAFLMTSVDTATRLARFTWQELFSPEMPEGRGGRIPPVLCNMYIATGLVVGIVALLLLGNPEAAKNLWNVFASANQLLAGLTLFTASLWLYRNRRAWWVTLFPMLFMLAVSSCGLYLLCTGSWKAGNTVLGVVTAILLALAAVLVLMAIAKFANAKRTIAVVAFLGAATLTANAGWEDVGAPQQRNARSAAPVTVTPAQTVAPATVRQRQQATQSGVPRTVREAAQQRAAARDAEARAKAQREAAIIEAERRRIEANSAYGNPTYGGGRQYYGDRRAPTETRRQPPPAQPAYYDEDDRGGIQSGDAFYLPFFDASRESDAWLHAIYYPAVTAPNGNDLKMAEGEARFLLSDVHDFIGGDLTADLHLKGLGFIDDAKYETLPYVFIEADIDVCFVWRFVNGVSLELGARPGVYGDPENFDASLFGYPLRGALYYSFSPELAVRAGAEVRPGWDMAVMPLVGLGWAPSEYFRLEAAVPRSLAVVHLGPFDLFGAVQWDNVTYAMEDKGPKPEDVTIDDWRVCGGLTIDLVAFRIGAEAGYIMGREFKAEGSKGSGTIEIKDSPYFGATLGSRF